MQIINQTKNITLADKVEVANTLCTRVVGLLNRREFKPGEALIIKPCNSIHTFFMRFSIDALFVDKQNRVIKIIFHLKPWRLSGICLFAHLCIELPAGTAELTSTAEGDLLSL